jgi:protease-4
MNILPDLMFEREKLRAQIKKWKWLFFGLLAIVIFAFVNKSPKDKSPFIARINIEGSIVYNAQMIKRINSLAEEKNVRAVIVDIDSPGSTAFAGEELYIALKKLSAKKPVVAVLKTMATSGGYLTALGANYIVARNMTITGSIGVLWQSFEAVELANKLGIKFVSVKSSPLKASPNPMEQTSEEAKEVVMEAVQEDYAVFLSMLMESRKMTKEKAIKIADGRVYNGIAAQKLGLVDQIGGEDEALAWLENVNKIPAKTRIIDVSWEEQESLYKELTKFLGNANAMIDSGIMKQSGKGALFLK